MCVPVCIVCPQTSRRSSWRPQLFYSRAGMSSEDTIRALQQVPRPFPRKFEFAAALHSARAFPAHQWRRPLQQSHPHLELDRAVIEAAKTQAFHDFEKVSVSARAQASAA